MNIDFSSLPDDTLDRRRLFLLKRIVAALQKFFKKKELVSAVVARIESTMGTDFNNLYKLEWDTYFNTEHSVLCAKPFRTPSGGSASKPLTRASHGSVFQVYTPNGRRAKRVWAPLCGKRPPKRTEKIFSWTTTASLPASWNVGKRWSESRCLSTTPKRSFC